MCLLAVGSVKRACKQSISLSSARWHTETVHPPLSSQSSIPHTIPILHAVPRHAHWARTQSVPTCPKRVVLYCQPTLNHQCQTPVSTDWPLSSTAQPFAGQSSMTRRVVADGSRPAAGPVNWPYNGAVVAVYRRLFKAARCAVLDVSYRRLLYLVSI